MDSRSDPDFIVIAGTDAIAVEGFEAGLDRAKAYEKAGADVLFVGAPTTLRTPWSPNADGGRARPATRRDQGMPPSTRMTDPVVNPLAGEAR